MSSPGAPSAGPSTPPIYSSGPSTPSSYSSGPSRPPNYSSGSSRNAEYSNRKHLRGKISVLKATMNMHMHPEQQTVNSAALLHEVLNEWKNLIWSSLSFAMCNVIRKSVLNNEGKAIGQRKVRPIWNNAQIVNHQNFSNNLTHPHPRRNFVLTTVITNSGKVPVNTAKQSSPRAATSTSTAKYINTATTRPIVDGTKPSSDVFHKSHSPVRKTFNQRTTPKTSDLKETINTAKVNNVITNGTKVVIIVVQRNGEYDVKSSACWILRPTRNVIDYISKDSGSYMLKRFNYVDLQGRLKSIDGGFVAFGGSPKGGKISRKGKIKTGKLDFEDVYFVKELKFNLFSVLQMRDKKNSVLFTETECLVLSPDFKLLDENQVSCLKFPDITICTVLI
nr:ribonuclease H-like domain-containing protein [Tanacetum cinerariifolium]